MFKVFTISILFIIPILARNQWVPDKNIKDDVLGKVQKEIMVLINKAIDESINHQEKNNVTELLDVPYLTKLKEQLKDVKYP